MSPSWHEHHVHRLLVLDTDGKPAGIVTASDVTNAVAAGRHFELEEDDLVEDDDGDDDA